MYLAIRSSRVADLRFPISDLNGGGMAMMVRANCRFGCCFPPDRGTARQLEKRETARWCDEYEDRPGDEARGCPKGGLACRCHLYDEAEVGDVPPEGVYRLGES